MYLKQSNSDTVERKYIRNIDGDWLLSRDGLLANRQEPDILECYDLVVEKKRRSGISQFVTAIYFHAIDRDKKVKVGITSIDVDRGTIKVLVITPENTISYRVSVLELLHAELLTLSEEDLIRCLIEETQYYKEYLQFSQLEDSLSLMGQQTILYPIIHNGSLLFLNTESKEIVLNHTKSDGYNKQNVYDIRGITTAPSQILFKKPVVPYDRTDKSDRTLIADGTLTHEAFISLNGRFPANSGSYLLLEEYNIDDFNAHLTMSIMVSINRLYLTRHLLGLLFEVIELNSLLLKIYLVVDETHEQFIKLVFQDIQTSLRREQRGLIIEGYQGYNLMFKYTIDNYFSQTSIPSVRQENTDKFISFLVNKGILQKES